MSVWLLAATAPDLQTLASTAAASAAALVAITGGLLVSRLVSLSAEKEGLRHQLNRLDSQIEKQSDQVAVLQATVLETARRVFRERHLSEFVGSRCNVRVIEAAKEVAISGISTLEVAEIASRLVRDIETVRKEVDKLFLDEATKPTTRDEIESRIACVNDDLQPIYAEVEDAVADEHGLARLTRGHRVAPAPVSGDNDAVLLKEQVISKSSLEAHIQLMTSEREVLDRAIRDIGTPRGVFRGIAVLGYFALVGVALPLFLLAYNPNDTRAWPRELVVWQWCSGLALLLAHIAWSVVDLQRAPGTND